MRAIYDYIIYTDGGCECNPGGRGGYGAVIINNNTGEFTDISGGFRSTTNNRMEVMAVIKALEKIKSRLKMKRQKNKRQIRHIIKL